MGRSEIRRHAHRAVVKLSKYQWTPRQSLRIQYFQGNDLGCGWPKKVVTRHEDGTLSMEWQGVKSHQLRSQTLS